MVLSAITIGLFSITANAADDPTTEYTIAVYYSSGASSADGLEEKTSDESGIVSWSWKIGAKTKAGKWRIVIQGGGETLETYIEVTE